jgi:hypothetical protein
MYSITCDSIDVKLFSQHGITAQVLNHLYFILSASSQQFSGATFASAKAHRSVFLSSSFSSPCFELVNIPLETLEDDRARAVENNPIGVLTLRHSSSEDSVA